MSNWNEDENLEDPVPHKILKIKEWLCEKAFKDSVLRGLVISENAIFEQNLNDYFTKRGIYKNT